MSDFASMLASLKSTAAASASTSIPTTTTTTTTTTSKSRTETIIESVASNQLLQSTSSTPAASKQDRKNKLKSLTTKKRPYYYSQDPSSHSFSTIHHCIRRKNKNPGGFELSFLVIGAQKAGTSWLHALLQKCNHPRISLPRQQKEVHFWDWHYRKGFDWYIQQFDYPNMKNKKLLVSSSSSAVAAAAVPPPPPPTTTTTTTSTTSSSTTTTTTTLHELPDHDNNHILYGEITPCYIVLPPTTISEIVQFFPKLKLIFIARDMVDRVWSAMIMELRDQAYGRNPGVFAEGGGVVMAAPPCWDTTTSFKTAANNHDDVVSTAHDRKETRTSSKRDLSVAKQRRIQQQSLPSSQSDAYFMDRLRSETHTSRSDYASHLRHWYTRFPSQNILIIPYNEIDTNPRNVLIMVLIHIGVKDADARAHVEKLKDEEVRQRVNAAPTIPICCAGPASSLSERPRLKQYIQDYVRPFAVAFNLLLKEQGYTWRLNE